MRPLTLEEFEARSADYDARVLAAKDLDPFCSGSAWILSANEALSPGREPWIRESPHGYAAFMAESDGRSRILQPLEASWCFACPLVGGDPQGLARDFAEALRGGERGWQAAFLAGLVEGSPLHREVVGALSGRYRLVAGPVTRRHVADLSGGYDAFLEARPAKLRKSLRAAERRAQARGISFEAASADAAAFGRMVDVESRSWKGRDGGGIVDADMQDFYRRMLPRLAARGAARILFARHEGRDVGFVLGGVAGSTYRGLQFSFDDAYRDCSLGHLMQARQVRALCAEGLRRYDLGQEKEYKARWAEGVFDTVMLVVVRA